MRLKDFIICFVCVILAILLLTIASLRLPEIRNSRQELGLVIDKPENIPPSLQYAVVALGAFRGLIVDALWMRADRLKEEGRFFDAKQLAEWITTLQPRFPAVWDFQAWNMAYNISVAIPRTQWQERWRWVRNGYELLRDKGIEKNPHSIILYRSLAWIFQHKISGITDDCHRYYKREIALEMRSLLGKNPTNERFEVLANTPESFDEILKDPEVAEFVNALKSVDDLFKDNDRFVVNYISLRQSPAKYARQTFEVIDRFRDSEALKKFDTFAKAWQLRKKWKFDIETMIKLNKKYGPASPDDPNDHQPLNWEHPDVHAIYWAQRGLDMAGKPGKYSIDEKNTDRIIFHSLQSLYRRGDLILYDIPGKETTVFLRPDLDMFDSCNKAWIDRIEKYETLEKGNPKAIRGGYKNMLKNAVLLMYQAGRKAKAAQILRELQRRYPDPEHNVDLVTFCRQRLIFELKSVSLDDAVEMILMELHEAYFRYAVHQDDVAYAKEQWAKEIYDIYQNDMGLQEDYRMGMPPFEMLRYLAFMNFVIDPYYPEHMKRSLYGRIQVEKPELYKKLQEQQNEYLKKIQNNQGQQP